MGKREDSIDKMEFVSPIYATREVACRLNGIIHKLAIPKTKPGWYNIKPRDLKRARVTGEADLGDVDSYLNKLLKVRFVIVHREDDVFYGVPLKNNTVGLSISQLTPIFLVNEDMVQTFDMVVTRCDGANFWYQDLDVSNDPSKSEYLRDQLEKYLKPEKIHFSGLTIEEKHAYAIRYQLDEKLRERSNEEKIKDHVEHAGGQFVRFQERRDHYSVTYTVDGSSYTSYVTKDDNHHVLTAGICLSGKDRDYDLTSLITVLREGQDRGLIYRFDNTH